MNTTAPPILDRLSVLGDETRTRILAVLQRGEFTVSELCATLHLAQPNVSRHLRVLAEDGWVDVRADGRLRHYRLSPTLDEPAAELWRLVRSGLTEREPYGADGERAEGVLSERRARSAEFFAGAADRWDEIRRELFGSRAEVLPLFALLDERWTVGDLGCGTGALAEILSPHVAHVVAVDRSDAMIAAARRRLERCANVDVRYGDLESLPVTDGTLDLAVLSLVMHYVVDPPDVLAEAHRVLRPGGRILIVDMRTHDRGPTYAARMGHVWPGFASERMRNWLTEAGFADIQDRPLPADPEAHGPLLFLATARRPHGPHEGRPTR